MTKKINPYPGTEEIAPGVYLYQDDSSPEIYFADDKGEIVMWLYREIQEDPEAWTASLRALAMGTTSLRNFAPGGFPRERRK